MKDWETADPALNVCDVRDFVRLDIPPRDLLLSPWLESASLAMIYAARGVGKTYFAANIAHALATGGDFLHWKTTKPVPVLYVDGEMPAPDMQARLSRMFEATGKEPEPGMFRMVSRDLQRFNDMPNLADPEGQKIISANMGDARVIVLDNLSSLIHGAKENEAEGWEPVAQWAIRERSKGRALIFVHHAGKNGGQRGTSKREDLLDVVIKLQRPADYRPQDGARFEVHFEKARSLFGQAVTPFEAQLAESEDGKPRWSVTEAEDDGRLRELHAQGLSLAKIGEAIGCDKSTVKRRLDRMNQAN
jgi:hypothetical protein